MNMEAPQSAGAGTGRESFDKVDARLSEIRGMNLEGMSPEERLKFLNEENRLDVKRRIMRRTVQEEAHKMNNQANEALDKEQDQP